MHPFEFEDQYQKSGYDLIAGIDEVGRGCLFGDVVACAIIMPKDAPIEGVKDSKKLSPKRRQALYGEILSRCIGLGLGRVDAKVIDEINIKQATRLAMKKAVENIRAQDGSRLSPDLLLVDAEEIESPIKQISIVHGDDLSYTISCASIVAKVFRDRLCIEWADKYPGYGLEKHKGYGTALHRGAIKKLGPSPLHRLSFLKNILKS